MISKQDLLKLMEKEFATTLRVMQAFPSGKDDFKPHERSSGVLQLTSTFVFEMYLLGMYLFGDSQDPSKFKTYKPGKIEDVIEDFQKETSKAINQLEQLAEGDLSKTISFAGHSFVADEFALMMLHDQIHHRGQLSVYVRMAGGKVPSVYGPSADDKSTNF